MPKFEADITIKGYTTVIVEADTENEARNKIENMWFSDFDCDKEEIEIDDIKEIESEEEMLDEQRDDGITGHLFSKKK